MSELSIGEMALESLAFRLRALRDLGEGAIAQLTEEDLHWSPGPESNSIAVIVQHLHGNMLSRWTDFLTSDGDKPWRDRDGEFTPDPSLSRDEVLSLWEKGWRAVFSAIASLAPGDLLREVRIRGQGMSALDAIMRQVSHYGYHVGQIVFLARMRKGGDWKTLSIPKGESKVYRPIQRD